MSIMANHNIGSAESQVVRAASRYMNEIEMLDDDRRLAYLRNSAAINRNLSSRIMLMA